MPVNEYVITDEMQRVDAYEATVTEVEALSKQFQLNSYTGTIFLTKHF